MMLATNDAVDILRHGWQDAAGIFAPDRPEIAEMLRARVEEAAAGGDLDESHLMRTVDEVELIAAGDASISGQALTRRLRRTVYEYLLALDAAPALPSMSGDDAARAALAAMGMPAAEPAVADEEPADAAPADAGPPDAASAEAGPAGEEPAGAVDAVDIVEASRSAADGLTADADDPPWQYDVDDADEVDISVAPKVGFHIVESTHPSNVPGEAPTTPMTMPSFADDADQDEAPSQTDMFPTTGAAAVSPSDEVAEAETDEEVADAEADAEADAVADADTGPADDAAAAGPAAGAPHLDDEAGWHVRADHGAPESNAVEDPFTDNIALTELRHRIDDRLRRKRCDEAAALLQELAQETGGRVVADLAMDAGDRCQTLGKSNAALNCYLAASRADPIYELPLSRLADICIDDQDTELAVSYLERIARLYRYRGDDRAALRVYRRIATIAPYREDVLELLLNAQRTGQLD